MHSLSSARRVYMTLLALLLFACNQAQPDQPPKNSKTLRFSEAVGVLTRFSDAKGSEVFPGVVSVRLSNHGKTGTVLTKILPKPDPGLKVTYLGYSTCKTACVGAMMWSEDVPDRTARSLLGRLPVQVPASEDELWLVFKLNVDADGVETLKARCRLQLREVVATLADGTRVRIRKDWHGAFAAIHLYGEAQPKCPERGNPFI